MDRAKAERKIRVQKILPSFPQIQWSKGRDDQIFQIEPPPQPTNPKVGQSTRFVITTMSIYRHDQDP